MMNMIQLQEQLKDFSQDQLINEMRMPSGNVPQYLVLSEMQRRKRMEAAAAGDQGRPQTTVAEDAVAAAGVPQGGIADMARSLAPQTDMTQNTGQGQSPVTGMSGGGAVRRMQEGGLSGVQSLEEIIAELNAYEGGATAAPYNLPFTPYQVSPEEYAALLRQYPNAARSEPPMQTLLGPRNNQDWAEELFGPIAGRGRDPDPEGTALAEQLGAELGPRGYGAIDPLFPGHTESELLRSHTGSGIAPRDTTPSLREEPDVQDEQPAEAPEAPTSDETGGAGGAGGTSDADRLAEQDRWLALARFGLGLMSSRSPTFGGAIGEAGMDALDYMQDMEQQRFERDLAERTLAARSAGSGQEGMRPPTGGDLLDRMAQIDESLQSLSMNVNGAETDPFTAEAIARLTAERAQIAATLGFGAPGSGGPTYDVSD